MTVTVSMTSISSIKKSPVAKKAKWDKPVSKTIYARIRTKAEAIAQSVAQGSSFVDYVMGFIDDYLTYREVPHWTVHKVILGYFHALKDDIDKAIERCERARKRAAEKKAEKDKIEADEGICLSEDGVKVFGNDRVKYEKKSVRSVFSKVKEISDMIIRTPVSRIRQIRKLFKERQVRPEGSVPFSKTRTVSSPDP